MRFASVRGPKDVLNGWAWLRCCLHLAQVLLQLYVWGQPGFCGEQLPGSGAH